MAVLTHKCPHCLTDHIALVPVMSTQVDDIHAALFLQCPKCRFPASSLLRLTIVNPTAATALYHQAGEVTDLGWQIVDFWPLAPEPNIPHHLPPDVVRVYLQAERNFAIEGNEEAAGTMYGKALDIGLKKIDPSLSGMLGPRIKKLAADGKLTADIAVWSENIRDVRNDAVHEENPISRDELTDLRNFTEMVLRYLFSLPNAVKKRRGEKLDWETAEATPTAL